MEHGATATLLVLLIDGWQERGVEMAPLEGPEGSGKIGVGISCIFLTGGGINVDFACVVHVCAFPRAVIPGRMTIRFSAVDEHTVPG